MIIKQSSMAGEVREKMRGGEGAVKLSLLPKEALPARCRLAGRIVLEKGCSIGEHKHEGETELFYCISGEGIVDDSGTVKPFCAGDATMTGGGAYHSIRNEKDEPLVFMAVIILD
ncbi:MAG: cupin domain-containing protein [Bacillota bacterium]|nr:cupin domain-containing protein [Bacillota bacterium]